MSYRDLVENFAGFHDMMVDFALVTSTAHCADHVSGEYSKLKAMLWKGPVDLNVELVSWRGDAAG